MLLLLCNGDALKITRLDRLGRSVLHLVTLGAELRDRGVGLHVIERGIDTSTPEGRAMFGTLSALAELQRELIVANTRDGLAAARARGRNGGRPPKLDAEQSSSHSSSMTRARGRSSRSRTYSGCLAPTVYGHLDLSSKRKRLTKPSMVASPVAHVGGPR